MSSMMSQSYHMGTVTFMVNRVCLCSRSCYDRLENERKTTTMVACLRAHYDLKRYQISPKRNNHSLITTKFFTRLGFCETGTRIEQNQ